MKNAIVFILMLIASVTYSQGLKTQGKIIVNSQGDEVILRGLGPGGWQIMEGYMMQTSGIAGTQHEIREKLVDLMGEENTETFFQKWRENHFTQRDVDSLAAWGFNSIRIPMHYNLFTLPIEDEPVQGEHTWIETGFELIDDVLEWSAPHGIYVILDMHACPGGQGTASAEINDYDPDKSSLWEDHPNDPGGSQRNKDKTVALWTRIADRYKDEEWIGGYDLINETHFNLPGGTELRELYEDITEGVRSVDSNHIIFIEGNWYANDFTGLTPPWDDNMVYSFHKYWSFTNENDLDWVLPLRDQYNIPLWMGESGENSNTWFTDAVTLFENNGIGWAWWTMRKVGDIDSPYAVDINPGYQMILDYWNPNVSAAKPTEQEAFDGMMQLAEDLLVDNSSYRKDVPDALIRQVATDETIPYSHHSIPGLVFMSDFDLGKNHFAYYDKDAADYNLSTGSFQAWNSGWSYRNDGVDIETNTDAVNSNGYHIGFTQKGEWVSYTVQITESGAYSAEVRLASNLSNAKYHLSLNNQSITPIQSAPNTGGWTNFITITIQNIILEEGEHTFKVHFDESAVNMGSIEFIKTGSSEALPFFTLTGQAGVDEMSVELAVNKPLLESSLAAAISTFTVKVNGNVTEISAIEIGEGDRIIALSLADPILYTDVITVDYNGSMIKSVDEKTLETFSNLPIINTLAERYALPGKVEAEDYVYQVGLGTESTTDTGGGINIGYTDVGDYADYKIFVRNTGDYVMNLRVAAQSKSGRVGFYLVDENSNETELVTISTPVTGGWQSWQTVSESLELPAGLHTLRMKVLSSGFNINWFEVEVVLGTKISADGITSVYPNPTSRFIHVSESLFDQFTILSMKGVTILQSTITDRNLIDLQQLSSGPYILHLLNEKTGKSSYHTILISK